MQKEQGIVTERTMEELCSCIPAWLKKHLPIGETICAGCLEKVSTGEYSCLRQFLGYPCFKKRDRVHAFSIIFHIDKGCTAIFDEEMRKTGREKLFERVPSVQLISREAILSKHKLTGLQCSHCGTAEQTQVKLANCARCKQVRYCNTECQHAHYPEHKEFCLAKARGMAAAAQKKQEGNVDIGERCPCFNEEDARIYNQAARNECCAKGCTIKIGGPVYFGCFATSCTLPASRQKEVMHMIPTTYCSDGCMKKTTNPKTKKNN